MRSRADENGASALQAEAGTDAVTRDLAHLRYEVRKFLRFSELAARQHGVTPAQHQLLLGVEGFTGRGSATISELAEFLQARHHSVVGPGGAGGAEGAGAPDAGSR